MRITDVWVCVCVHVCVCIYMYRVIWIQCFGLCLILGLIVYCPVLWFSQLRRDNAIYGRRTRDVKFFNAFVCLGFGVILCIALFFAAVDKDSTGPYFACSFWLLRYLFRSSSQAAVPSFFFLLLISQVAEPFWAAVPFFFTLLLSVFFPAPWLPILHQSLPLLIKMIIVNPVTCFFFFPCRPWLLILH